MKSKITLQALLILGLTLLILTGCEPRGKQYKQDLMQAFDKSLQIHSYADNGQANLMLPANTGAQNGSGSAAERFLGLFRNAQYRWNGVSDLKAAHEENTIQIKPDGAQAAIQIPVMIQHNKLYFRIPAFNLNDEWFSYDLSKSAGIDAQTLGESGHVLTSSLKILLSGIGPRQFQEQKQKQPNGETWTTVYLDVTKKNAKILAAAVGSQLPAVMDQLAKSKLIDQNTAAKLKADFSGSNIQNAFGRLQLAKPGKFAVTFDGNGFIRKELVDLSLTDSADGSAKPVLIHMEENLDRINQTQTFKIGVPKKVRDFAKVLQLLNHLPAAK